MSLRRFHCSIAMVVVSAALFLAGSAAAATLYAPIYADDQIAGFTTAADGSLVQLNGSPFSVPSGGTTGFAMTPDGTRGVTSYLFFGGVRGHSIDTAGVITPAQPKIAANEAYGAAVSPDGRFAYVPTRNLTRGVQVYSIDASGALTEIGGSPFMAGTEFGDVAITPDGKFLFGVIAGQIARFSIGADGTLVSLGNTALAGVVNLQTSPDGRFLFSVSKPGGGDLVTSFSIAADGALTQAGAPVPSGNVSADYAGVAPDGGFVYIGDSNADTVTTIRVAPDGTISAVGAPHAITNVQSIVVSPDGKFLYAMRDGGVGISGIWVSPIAADGRPVAFTFGAAYDPGEPERLLFRPSPAPVANFTTRTNAKPLSIRFDGNGSVAGRGVVTAYQWDFDGSGTVDASSTVADHTFSKPGKYQVSLRVADDTGCPAHQVYTGQTTFCPDQSTATKTVTFDTPPWIKSLKVSPRSVRGKAKIRYKLTEKARVTFFAERKTVGRVTGGKCRRATSKNRRAKKCTLWVRASKSFRHSGKSGSNSLKFSRKIGGKRLKARSYRLNAVAIDSAKGKSPVKTAPFKIR